MPLGCGPMPGILSYAEASLISGNGRATSISFLGYLVIRSLVFLIDTSSVLQVHAVPNLADFAASSLRSHATKAPAFGCCGSRYFFLKTCPSRVPGSSCQASQVWIDALAKNDS